jgi:uncharacterized protein
MASFPHGVRILELSDGLRPIQVVDSSIIGLVGTAPDAEAAFAASLTLGTGTAALTFTADTPGVAGNSITVRLSNPGAISQALSVSLDGLAITVSLATNGSGEITSTADAIKTALDANATIAALVNVTSGGTGVVTAHPTTRLSGGLDEAFPINTPFLVPGSRRIAARAGTEGTIPYSLDDIFRQTGAAVVVVRAEVGEDAEETETNILAAVQKLLESEAVLGVVPRILIAPEFSADKTVADELISVADKLKGFVYADGPDTTDAEAIAYAGKFGSARLAVVDPWLVRNGVTHAPSAAWAGATSKSDNERGFWWSPSNIPVLGFDDTTRPIPFREGDTTAEADLLNRGRVTTIINRAGRGLIFWGNLSTSADPQFEFICVRRIADILNDSIKQGVRWASDRPITRTLLDDIAESVNAVISGLVNQGALYGGRCYPDPDYVSEDEIASGSLNFRLEFGPVYPAQTITFRSILVGDYITEALL